MLRVRRATIYSVATATMPTVVIRLVDKGDPPGACGDGDEAHIGFFGRTVSRRDPLQLSRSLKRRSI